MKVLKTDKIKGKLFNLFREIPPGFSQSASCNQGVIVI